MNHYPETVTFDRETVQDIEDLLSGIVDMEIDSFEHEPSEDHTFLALAKIFSKLAEAKGESSYWKVEGIAADRDGYVSVAADGGNVEAKQIWQTVEFCLAQKDVIGIRIT